MLKKLQICFLGYLCPFPNRSISKWWRDFFCINSTRSHYLTAIGGLFHRRSRSISRHSKNYLSDKGAVFRQPQADISQKRSDFISQAEGLCISNFLNQKWFVKTFLILSILLSSINEVSSQVADSPGADLPHRSRPIVPHGLRDTHRGGDSRSDTLPEQNGLVDHSAAKGQKGESSSAKVGVGLFQLELPVAQAPDTLWLTYWTHLLKEHADVTPGIKVPLVGDLGNFFEGNSGYKVYRWKIPDSESPLNFNVLDGRTYLFRYWTFFPGNEVRVRSDLAKGMTYFAGSSANFFRAQYEISRLAGDQKLNAVPLMVTADSSRILADSLSSKLYLAALSRKSETTPVMEFVMPGINGEELLDRIFAEQLSSNPLVQSVPMLIEKLEAPQQEIIRQRAWAEVLAQLLPRLGLSPQLLSTSRFRPSFESMVNEIPIPDSSATLDPSFLQGIYELMLLQGRIEERSLKELVAGYPQEIRDHLVGLYVLANYKAFDVDQESLLNIGEEQVQTAWIAELLSDIRKSSEKGTEFHPGLITGKEGSLYDMQKLKGKTLVISFWISGCKFCMNYYQKTLLPVFNHFRDHEDIVFVSINADPNSKHWKSSMESGLYSHPEMIQLHQDSGTGILKEYRIASFPQKLLISPDFRLHLLTTKQYTADTLIQKINEMVDSKKYPTTKSNES